MVLVIGDNQLHQSVQNLLQGSDNPRRVLLHFTIDQAKQFRVQEWTSHQETDDLIANHLAGENQFIFYRAAERFQVWRANEFRLAVNRIIQIA